MTQNLFLELYKFYHDYSRTIEDYDFMIGNKAKEMFEKLKILADELEKEKWR
jgi:hypothetical protein